MASAEVTERGFGVGDLRDLGLKARNSLRVWRGEELKKSEEEKERELKNGTHIS